ncbi:hypothetical protein CC014_18245 [Salmonella enterica]|nr:hypothetical protein [Salmonella enterica]EFO5648737.1 hypothetical protein [Salmonella enterica subsp. enterica serovar Miami]EAT1014602.1 hypothetical protein [Salmonella enterica]EBB2055424.1 hypothetical protein [Salmonella enterica]EBN0646552.1 hypothetical protein [Salmonella enterica]
MKRRTFLGVATGAALGGLIPTASSKDNRLYGVPQSINPRSSVSENEFRISMSKANVPIGVWEDIIAFNRLWEDIKDDPSLARDYHQNNERILNQYHIEENILEKNSIEEALLLITYDKSFVSLVNDNDYEGVFYKLKDYGFKNKKSTLRERIRFYESQDESLVDFFKDIAPNNVEYNNIGDNVAYKRLLELFSRDDMGEANYLAGNDVALANAVAVVNVAAATRVVAAVNVGAAVNVVTQISIATNLSVFVSGACNAYLLPKLNPYEISIGQATLHLASIYNNQQMVDEIIKESVRREVTACMFAAHKCGFLKLPSKKEDRKEVMKILTDITLSVGIA